MKRYVVKLYFCDGEETHFLGEWSGVAESGKQAEKLAYDLLWDVRLDCSGCRPKYLVSIQEGDHS